MPSDSGATTSPWMHERAEGFAPLENDVRADVCVVGAGITGLTTAYLLQRVGRAVVVLDAGAIGSGETGRTTAHLSNALDEGYCNLERLHGERATRLAAESHTAAIDQIEAIVNQEGIECDFERLDGYLFLARGDSAEKLEDELGAALRAGVADVRLLPRVPGVQSLAVPCMHFPRQAQFHPLRYLEGLARALVRDGGRVFTGTRVAEVRGGKPCRAVTESGHTVHADSVVVATNVPVNGGLVIHTKLSAYRTYVIGVRIPRGSVPRALYWDTEEPYHYARLQRESDSHDLLIVGGEDHRTGQAHDTRQRFERLEAWARRRFGADGPVVWRWSGQVMEPVDGLAFIGRNPLDAPHVYIATGDAGQGMTHGTIAGMLVRDLICGKENPWAALYDPGRKVLRGSAVRRYARENLNVARQYARYVRRGEVSHVEQIAPGSGALMRHGPGKIAVYRDPAGSVHTYSAVCPHARCIVRWNETEESWDCPCHGSRFDPHGHVICGPANARLEPVYIEGITDAGGLPELPERPGPRTRPN
ncbi:MAG: FAD-dependent oxidoreductase [Pseudomonadota bacterium]|nr:MAG: FAD-dependent oxidoreductase [Pseudomonadota bacterium]